MAADDVLGFMNALASDPDLRAKVDALASDDVKGLMDMAASSGHAVSAADLEAVRAHAELGDAALDQVSGGLNPQPLPPGGMSALFNRGGLVSLNPQPLPPRWAFQTLARFGHG